MCRNYSRDCPCQHHRRWEPGTCWESWHWWFLLPVYLVLLPQTLSLPDPVHTGSMSPILVRGWWQMLINLQCCILWAHPDGCGVQPSSQSTREVLGDEAGPRLTQGVSLQAGAWLKGVREQQQARLSWREGLSPAWLLQRLKDQSLDRHGRDPMWDWLEPSWLIVPSELQQPGGNTWPMKEKPVVKLFLFPLKKFCNSIQLFCCHLTMKRC